MMKQYVRFRAEGTGEDARPVVVEGLCDARRDPMAVAMGRSVLLRRCRRVKLTVEQAFRVACSGDRERRRADIRRQGREDEAWRAMRKRMAQELDEEMTMREMAKIVRRKA
ncbi:MAG: hypothetical protein ACI4MJ_01165 [Aristaeellaceae bacterium]